MATHVRNGQGAARSRPHRGRQDVARERLNARGDGVPRRPHPVGWRGRSQWIGVGLGLAAMIAQGCRDDHGPRASATPPPAEAAELRVVSYNAWLVPLVADDFAERLERIGPALAALEPDVLCLQEVWSDGALDALSEHLAEALPHVAKGGGGLAILSRFPIARSEFVRFEDDDGLSLAERLGRKGVLIARLETPAGPIDVLDSHLAFARRGARKDAQTRQLETLIARSVERRDVPNVLAADLNLRAIEDGRRTAGYDRLLDAGYVDTVAVERGEDGRWERRPGTRVGWPRQGRRAGWDPDYVMVRGGEEATFTVRGARQALDTPESALSDHNALIVDLVLTPR